VRRHKAGQKFNMFRTIDSVQGDRIETSPDPETRPDPPRPRYSFKTRTRQKEHPPPPTMKLFKWKPFSKVPDNPVGIKPPGNHAGSKPPAPARRKPPPVSDSSSKAELVRAMAREHPTVVVQAGTLAANVNRAMGDSPLVHEVRSCLREIIKIAADTKRKGQQLIGRFIEAIYAQGGPTADDKTILSYLCPNVSSKVEKASVKDSHEEGEDEDEEKEDQEQEIGFDDPPKKESEDLQFYATLLQYLYSQKDISKGLSGQRVQKFVHRAINLGLLPVRNRGNILDPPKYAPSILLRSVAHQLNREIKRMYRKGCIDLERQVQIAFMIHPSP